MGAENTSLIPGRQHYDGEYLGADFARMFSYQTQIAMAVRGIQPARILVVGVGDGLVVHALRVAGIKVITLDISRELDPDLVASVESIPLEDRSVDVTICCQVLEHLPFDSVDGAVAELCRVSSKRVIVSVPDQRRYASVRFAFLGKKRAFATSPPRFRPQTFERWRLEKMGHYWEVGFREWPIRLVEKTFKQEGWKPPRMSRVPDFPWHLFIEINRHN